MRASEEAGRASEATGKVLEAAGRVKEAHLLSGFSFSFFSRDAATLYERVSVRRLVGWLVRRLVGP